MTGGKRFLTFAPLIGLLAMMAGCTRQATMPDAFPETLAGWHRTAVRDLPAAQPPDALPAVRIESIRAATYDGPGKLEARVYALPSPATALDVVQRWTPRPDTVFFYSDRFFVVVEWQTADKKALHAFLAALQKRFDRK
jgi:hypothetical protein